MIEQATSKRVTIDWFGPIPLEQFPERRPPAGYEEKTSRNGIYLHCFKSNDELYVPFYVGKADTIINRQQEHRRSIRRRKATLLSLKDKERPTDILFIPDYGYVGGDKPDNVEKRITELIEININSTHVVFGITEADQDLYELEGALQIHFWKKSDYRRHLITHPSNYSLRNCEITNNLSGLKDATVQGLDKKIQTATSDSAI